MNEPIRRDIKAPDKPIKDMTSEEFWWYWLKYHDLPKPEIKRVE